MTYFNLPPQSGVFSPTQPYGTYTPVTPASTDSYNSQHPLFSPTAKSPHLPGGYVYQSPTAYNAPQQVFDVHPAPSLPHRPRKLRHRIAHHIQRLWLWETSAIVVAIGGHLAMILMLGVYNNSRVSSWDKPLTLNSCISFLITVIKGAALIPVASSIGQLKWKRFRDYRKLTDLDYYDDASRGSLGSFRLLWHLRFWHLATFGALITIGALSMDTLAQNVVDTYHKLEGTWGAATIPRTDIYGTWNKYTSGDAFGDQLPWVPMITAINYGWSYTASQFFAGSVLYTQCRTGNCTFPPYQSLIVDGQCKDVTSHLDRSDPTKFQLPNGPYLRKEDGFLNMSSTTQYPTLNIFDPIGPLIVNFQAIANPDLKEPTAIQCVLYWATATFKQSNITNRILYEPVASLFTNLTEQGRTKYNQTRSIWLFPDECWINATQRDPKVDREDCSMVIVPKAQLGLQNFLTSPSIGMSGEGYKTKNGFYVSNLFANSLQYVTGLSRPNETYLNMERTMNNTAIMMTQAIRQLPVKTESSNETYMTANGTVYQYEQFFVIHFKYLGPTHFVVGGSLLFFVLTLYMTRTDHPWKNSNLPLLFHGLAPQDRAKAAEVPQMVDMREAAQGLKVKLAMTAVGQRFVTRETLATG